MMNIPCRSDMMIYSWWVHSDLTWAHLEEDEPGPFSWAANQIYQSENNIYQGHSCYTKTEYVFTGKVNILTLSPISPHDALKHNFTSLKTDLIFL